MNTRSRNGVFVQYEPEAKRSAGKKDQRPQMNLLKPRSSSSSKCKKTRTTPRKGAMTRARRAALCQAYAKFRPDGVPHGETSNAWRKITDTVNEVDSNKTDVKKATLYQEFKRTMKEYEYLLKESEQGRLKGCYCFPRFTQEAYEKMKSDQNASKEEKDSILKEIQENERQEKWLENQALEGYRYHLKKEREKEKENAETERMQSDACRNAPPEMPYDLCEPESQRQQSQHAELLRCFKQLREDNLRLHDDNIMIYEELRQLNYHTSSVQLLS